MRRRVKSSPVILDSGADHPFCVNQPHAHMISPGMLGHIRQRLLHSPVYGYRESLV